MTTNRKDIERDAINQKLYAASKPKNLAASITYGNANTTGLYSGSVMASPRADANDHMSFASRDSGAMIVRCI